MIYLESPVYNESIMNSPIRVFIAGGITGCPDFQAKVKDALSDLPIVLMNPRRADFPIDDPGAAQEQIKWEFDHLAKATDILFWFCADETQPIVLFEYGKWLGRLAASMLSGEDDLSPNLEALHVGVDPAYPRTQDVLIQTSLEMPDLEIHRSLDDLVASVRKEVSANLGLES